VTGEEIGVMKAVEEASATIMANGYGDAPRSADSANATLCALSHAIGCLVMLAVCLLVRRFPDVNDRPAFPIRRLAPFGSS
jgi:hypothetical protein